MDINSHNTHQRTRIIHIAMLIAIFAISFSVRLIRYNDAIYDGSIQPLGVDSYYHLRRVHLAARDWPALIEFDSYQDYPRGSAIVHPPGYDFFLATLGYCAGGGNYDKEVVDLVAALVPPIFGAATTLIVLMVGQLLFNRQAGYWAALLHALLLGGIWVGEFGAPDHHVMESFFVPLIFFLLLKCCSNNDQKARQGPGFLVFIAVIMSSAQLMWRGAIMYLLFFLCSAVLLLLRSYYLHNDPDRSIVLERLKFLGWALLLTAVLLFPFARLTYFGRKGELVYYALSLFQPLTYMIFGLSIFLTTIVLSRTQRLKPKQTRLIPALLLVVSLLFLTGLIVYRLPVLSGLVDGGLYIIKSDPWMQTINETRPLFSMNPGKSLDDALLYFGYWILVNPLLIVLVGLQKKTFSHYLLIAWSLFNLALAILQIRYSHQLVITVSLLSGAVIMQISRVMGSSIQSRLPGTGSKILIPTLISFLIFLVMSAPSLNNLSGYFRTRFERESALPLNLVETLHWLKRNTPETSYFLDPCSKPEYGIMSIWDYGNWITYIAQRPVIASNFGFLHKGLLRSCVFLTTPSWPEIKKMLTTYQARYIILGNFSHRLKSFRRILSHMAPDKLPMGNDSELPVSEKLYWLDGCLTRVPSGLCSFADQLRLVYESPPDPAKAWAGERSNYLVYEFVKGAQLPVKGSPGLEYTLTTLVVTNQSRRFFYQQYGHLDGNGLAMVRLPYVTMQSASAVKTAGPYLLEIGEKQFTVTTESDQILDGVILETINLAGTFDSQ